MKKIFLLVIILIMCLTLFCACEQTDMNNENNQTFADIIPSNVSTLESIDNKENVGGYVACSIHHQDYHTIPGALIDYIGRERFYQWTEIDEGKEVIQGCKDNKTIYDCIHYFEVPRSALEEVYTKVWDAWVWNLDALCDDNKFVSDQFYRNVEQINSVHEKRAALAWVKFKIFKANYDEWTAIYGDYVPGTEHSIEYLVELFDISRTDLEGYIAEAGTENTYEYNLDVLYPTIQQGGSVGINSVGNTDTSDMTPIEKDALFCGIDDLYIE